MNAIHMISTQPWVERLGWTLLHFLWEGLSIAAVYAVGRKWSERLRSKLVRRASNEWQQVLDRLKIRLQVSRTVQLLVSSMVQVPVVVGWLRPAVLVPVGALAGLPSDQVEALLLHELAHIRRH